MQLQLRKLDSRIRDDVENIKNRSKNYTINIFNEKQIFFSVITSLLFDTMPHDLINCYACTAFADCVNVDFQKVEVPVPCACQNAHILMTSQP